MATRRTVVVAGVVSLGVVLAGGLVATQADLRWSGGADDPGLSDPVRLGGVSISSVAPGTADVTVVVRDGDRVVHDRTYAVQGPDDEDPDDGVAVGNAVAVGIDRTWSGRGEYVVEVTGPDGQTRTVRATERGPDCVRVSAVVFSDGDVSTTVRECLYASP
jgi:hypothetical protein